jgi:hypothetical protein
MKKSSNSTVTLTLKPVKPGTVTPKGHHVAYAAVLPEGIVGVVQGGASAREVLLIASWAPKAKKLDLSEIFDSLR